MGVIFAAGGLLLLLSGTLAFWLVVRRSKAATRQVRAQFAAVFQHTPSGLALVDGAGVVQCANDAFTRILGVDDHGAGNPGAADPVGRRLHELMPGESTGQIAGALRVALGDGAAGSRVELRLTRDGTERWLLASLTAVRGAANAIGTQAQLLVQFDEITAQRRAERQLIERTTRDPLTGLANRVLLFQTLDYAMRTGAAARSTVLYVDLDRFKWVNDTMGHSAGDAVLVAVAARLRALIRPGDLVTRVGGDEFVVVLRELFGADEAMDVAERIVLTLREPIEVSGREIAVHGSVGVSLPAASTDDAQARLADADTAMYRAKRAGGNRAELFTPPMRRARERHQQTDAALREALARDVLQLWYQPIVNLRTGRFDGVEALLRWPEHDGEIEDAIAVAEESDLIVALGDWVLQQALQDAPGGMLEINVSVRQLIRPDFTSTVLRALDEARVAPAQLCIEVTETSLADNIDAVVVALSALRAAGVRVAIDDFGTGHASLTYLAKFPVDIVKVDRSFVQGLGNDPASGVIVRSVAAMAHALGMTVIAEGVESLNQLEIVLEAGCDAAQGYLFSRPLPRQQCMETLNNSVPWPVGFSGRRASAIGRVTAPTVEPARRYRLLLDLARDITGRLDLDEVLAATFVSLRQLVAFGGGSIQLVDDTGESVRLAAADPPATPDAYETRVPIGQGIGGRIVASGEPRYIPDILRDPDVPDWRATSDGVRSYFGVPLITEGAVIGVLQVDAPDVDPLSEEDRFTILAFTPIVAAAIQNARLFEREVATTLVPRPAASPDELVSHEGTDR